MWNSDDYFTDEQLETAKQIVQRNFIRQNEKPSSLASQITYAWCSTSYEYYLDYTNNCQKVTKDDIKKYVERYITGKNYVAGTIINEAMNKQIKPAEFFKPNN